MSKGIVVITNKDELMALLQQVEQKKQIAAVNATLIIDDVDYDPIQFTVEDVFKFNTILGLFAYVCHHDTVVFSHYDNPKEGDVCPDYKIISGVYDLIHSNRIPSSAIMELTKFITEKTDVKFTDLIKKSTAAKEDQERVILYAMRYDVEYTLKVILDELKRQTEETVNKIKKIIDSMGGKSE